MTRWRKRVGVGLLVLFVMLILWGLIEPYTINEERETATIPNLPPEWEGRTVAVVADFQVGMWGANTGTIYRIVRRLVEQRPAAVLIVGDFVYKADGRVDEITGEVAELVRPLSDAGIPTFAVLGNHDYSLDLEEDPVNAHVATAVESALEGIGVRVLENEAIALTLRSRAGESQPLYIVGVGDRWAGRSHPARAVGRVPGTAARIVFMHNPLSFRDLPAGTAPLAVAAHTHGGQISVPFTPHWSWMTLVKDEHVEANGWAEEHEETAGNRLYVNVGIGFSDVPIRISAAPELTLFTLRRGANRDP